MYGTPGSNSRDPHFSTKVPRFKSWECAECWALTLTLDTPIFITFASINSTSLKTYSKKSMEEIQQLRGRTYYSMKLLARVGLRLKMTDPVLTTWDPTPAFPLPVDFSLTGIESSCFGGSLLPTPPPLPYPFITPPSPPLPPQSFFLFATSFGFHNA